MQVTKSSSGMTARTLRKIANRETNEVDRFVGERIHLYRAILGMSQQKLAEKLGVTLQQLQKYERGENRIGAGRLLMVATALGIPVQPPFYVPVICGFTKHVLSAGGRIPRAWWGRTWLYWWSH